jgi:ADP-heptose:LPS heptosyltransferase
MLTLTSVLPVLKNKYPNVSMDVLCHELSVPILARNPHVNRCIPFVHFLYDRRKTSLFRKVCRFLCRIIPLLQELRRARYDLCLNFRDSGGDMILVAKLGGCRYIVGHGTGGFAPLLDQVVPWQEGRHEVEHYLEVLHPLGVDASLEQLRYELYPSQQDEEYVAELIERFGLTAFVVIHPGSGEARKLVSPDSWAGIIDGTDTHSRVVFTGTKDENHLYEDAARLVKRETVNLMGLFTISQLYLFYRKAQRVYTVDSLSAHLAAMTGTRTTIFWSPWVDENQWRPLGDQVEILPRSLPQG